MNYLARVTDAIRQRPYTYGLLAFQIGVFVAPVATTIASVLYTAISLGVNSTREIEADIEAALIKRQKEATANVS